MVESAPEGISRLPGIYTIGSFQPAVSWGHDVRLGPGRDAQGPDERCLTSVSSGLAVAPFRGCVDPGPRCVLVSASSAEVAVVDLMSMCES